MSVAGSGDGAVVDGDYSMSNRYDVSSNSEGTWQPGSDEKVLLNKPGIVDEEEMNLLELKLLDALYDKVFERVTEDQSITVDELGEWHRMWLGNVYAWAGQLRTVTMSKGGFPFAAVLQLPGLMQGFEQDFLARYTPCQGYSEVELVDAIARVHVELILIHPFREGNGRLARLLAEVMALQAGYDELDFSSWDADKEGYIRAIHAGMGGDYSPMEGLVRQALLRDESV